MVLLQCRWIFFTTSFLSSVIKCAAFKQNDYTVKLLIFHVTNFNRSYYSNIKCDLHWLNRTTRVINCSGYLLKDLSMNIQMSTQIYKFASNEYRLFPVEMAHNLCSSIKEDPFGLVASLAKSLSVKMQCPFKKGWLNITNGIIDFTKFPPHIPRGQYMDQLIFYDNKNFVAEMQIEAVVEEIMKKWKN